MAIPLKDFRCAITEQIDAALDAQAAAFGKDKAAVAREVLGEWARIKHREHMMYGKRLRANGAQVELSWDEMEDDGASRSGRK
jgi:hypothetical protein